MVVGPYTTYDLYETDVATVTDYTTAGAASLPVDIHNVDTFTILVISGANESTDYKVQVNNSPTVDPLTDIEASAGWADFVAESTVVAGASEAIGYTNTGFRWVRIIQQLDTTTDDITWGISKIKSKII